MESKVFTNDLDEKLIVLVRENKVLYDFQDRNYKDNSIRQNVWKKIGSEIGRNGDDCKIRWRTIRDSYRKTINKTKTTTGSPAFSKSKYVNKNLQFLDYTFKERKVISNITPNAEPDEPIDKDIDPFTHSGLAENTVEENEKFEQLEGSSGSSSTTPDYLTPYKKKKWSAKEKIVEEVRKGREDRNIILNNVLSRRENKLGNEEKNHPMDLFFKSMCETAKTFPPHIAAQTKLKICQVINEMEMKMFQEQSSVGGGLLRIDTQTVTPNLRVHTISSPSIIVEGNSSK